MKPRLRFAPSPTGYLHIGGARTALFNYLYAKHTGGTLLLRIEDTDRERSTKESVDAILEGLSWLGIEPDEEIVYQSARMGEHVALANRLLAEGKAYKCFSTPEEVDEMRARATAAGRKPMYDGTWRDRSDHPEGKPFTLRFRMPKEGSTTIEDIVLGEMSVENEEMDDFILLRSDGTPTYNFVVVCDDAFMNVTHVVRGQDHVSNTFRQVHLYEALGHARPRFAHLPLVDGLSKRKGSASVQHYRDQGFLPEAVNNYIARLGWSHGDQEIFSMEELIQLFDLEDVNRSSGKYDEVKMQWVNQQWIRRLAPEVMAERILPYLAAIGIEAEGDSRLPGLMAALQERSNSLLEIAEGARFAFQAPAAWDEKAAKKWMKAGSRAAFEDLISRLEGLGVDAWTPATLEGVVQAVAETHELGMGKVAQPIRIALTGSSVSPPIDQTLWLTGQEECVNRMRAALHLFPDTSS